MPWDVANVKLGKCDDAPTVAVVGESCRIASGATSVPTFHSDLWCPGRQVAASEQWVGRVVPALIALSGVNTDTLPGAALANQLVDGLHSNLDIDAAKNLTRSLGYLTVGLKQKYVSPGIVVVSDNDTSQLDSVSAPRGSTPDNKELGKQPVHGREAHVVACRQIAARLSARDSTDTDFIVWTPSAVGSTTHLTAYLSDDPLVRAEAATSEVIFMQLAAAMLREVGFESLEYPDIPQAKERIKNAYFQ